MRNRSPAAVFAQSLFILFLAMSVNPSASAAQMTVDFTGLVKYLTGSMSGYFLIDEVAPTSQFSFSTDETQASLTNTVGSTIPGDSFDSLYRFSGAPNDISLTYPMLYSFPPTYYSFKSDNNIEVRVTNDRIIDQAASTALAGLVAPDTYDWVDLLWTGNGFAYDYSINSQTWKLSIIGNSTWFTDGKLIPDALPTTFALLLYASYDDTAGHHVGEILAIPSSYSVSAVPLPPALWLLASGIAGLGLTARRRQSV